MRWAWAWARLRQLAGDSTCTALGAEGALAIASWRRGMPTIGARWSSNTAASHAPEQTSAAECAGQPAASRTV